MCFCLGVCVLTQIFSYLPVALHFLDILSLTFLLKCVLSSTFLSQFHMALPGNMHVSVNCICELLGVSVADRASRIVISEHVNAA